MADELRTEYQVVAVDDGTSNERAGEILKPAADWDDETLRRWQGLAERMQKLGWLQRV